MWHCGQCWASTETICLLGTETGILVLSHPLDPQTEKKIKTRTEKKTKTKDEDIYIFVFCLRLSTLLVKYLLDIHRVLWLHIFFSVLNISRDTNDIIVMPVFVFSCCNYHDRRMLTCVYIAWMRVPTCVYIAVIVSH